MTDTDTIVGKIRQMLTPGVRYEGVTNRFMNKHTWKDGNETVAVYWMDGAPGHAGYVVEVTGEREATLQLNNGFISTPRKALILVDMYLRDGQDPAAFMHSDRVEGDRGPGGMARQDEWLDAHASDYEFAVIDPSEVDL